MPGIEEIKTRVGNRVDGNLKTALLVALSTANDDLEKLRDNIATWFDGSMDRLSVAYKRHLKFISLVVGLAVTVLFNADTLTVGRALWHDSALRAQMVQAAHSIVQQQTTAAGAAAVGAVPATYAAGAAAAGGAPDSTRAGGPFTELATSFKEANDKLLPLPIGWDCNPEKSVHWPGLHGGDLYRPEFRGTVGRRSF